MANTTNLNLVKPAGTDKALVSVLNSNSDKIDAWAGSTNQALSNIRNNEIVIPITADTDLNTLVKPGYYNLYSASSLVNAPVSGTNRLGLIVQRAESDSYIYQMAFENVQSGTGVYVRSCKGGTWSAWQQLGGRDWGNASSWCSNLESSASTYYQKYGSVRTISFQGVSRSHTEDEVLMTLPEGHRPLSTVYAIGNINGTPVTINLNATSGNVSLYLLNSAGSGRIYFSVTYIAND